MDIGLTQDQVGKVMTLGLKNLKRFNINTLL